MDFGATKTGSIVLKTTADVLQMLLFAVIGERVSRAVHGRVNLYPTSGFLAVVLLVAIMSILAAIGIYLSYTLRLIIAEFIEISVSANSH